MTRIRAVLAAPNLSLVKQFDQFELLTRLTRLTKHRTKDPGRRRAARWTRISGNLSRSRFKGGPALTGP